MTRFFFAPLLVLAVALPSLARDMPLSQILIDGEGWKKKPENVARRRPQVQLYSVTDPPGVTQVAGVLSADGATLLVGYADAGAVWAFRFDKGAGGSAGAPYCPLRLPRGQSKTAVTALAVDNDGRVYAATTSGIQVFDPTGRLCGVVVAPTSTKVEHLAIGGGYIWAWVGDDQYARKLNTTGAK